MNDSNVYDAPRMAYPLADSSFQYVAMPAQNAETDVINGDATNAVPSYVEPELASYPYTGLSGIVPYASGNIGGGGYNPGAFAVQSGYDGFLVPVAPQAAEEKEVEPKSNNELPFIGSITSTLTSLTNGLPTSMRSFATQAITIISAMLGLTVMGGGLTTAICTFTPLCTISFALPFTRSGLKTLAKPFVGEENVEILDSTLMRLSKMQDKEKDELAAKTSDNGGGAAAVDVTATKSVDGSDLSADVAGTIAKVAKVTKEAAATASAATAPAPKTTVNKSDDK